MALTHYNKVECHLVAPDQFQAMSTRLLQSETREQELSQTMPMVLAAAMSGVAIPSETLDRVPGLNTSWEAIAEFAATFPVRLTHGGHGEPLTRARLSTLRGPIGESGDDELNLD